MRAVRLLDLRTRSFVESLFSGDHASVFLGRGLDFSHVRPYQPGDDVRAIDWKVTARRGAPYVRQFLEERDLLVVLLVDISASGWRGPGEKSPGEIAAEIAAALAFTAVRNHDRVALLLVSREVERFVPPRSGRRHVMRVLTEMLSHVPSSTDTDLTPGLEHVARSLSGRATVFVLSDFIQTGPHDPFVASLKRACRAHDVIAIRLSSRATDELPSVGWVELTDPESGRRVVVDTGDRKVSERYRKRVLRAHARTASLLAEAGAELVDVDSAGDPLAVLSDFLRRRRLRRRSLQP